MPLVLSCNFCGSLTAPWQCEYCHVAWYCNEHHQNLDEKSHSPSCDAITAAKDGLIRKKIYDHVISTHLPWRHGDTDVGDDLLFPAEHLGPDFDHNFRSDNYPESCWDYVEALIKANTFAALERAAEASHRILRCCSSDPLELRNELPGVYLRLGRDQEAYSLIKWWESNELSAEEIHKSHPIVPYLDNAPTVDVFEQPSATISAIGGNRSLVNIFCVTLLKIKILFNLRILQEIQILHPKLPQELVNMVGYHLPLIDVVRKNRTVMGQGDYTGLIEDITNQINMCFEAVEEENTHLWPSLVNSELRPGGSVYRPSADKRTVDFVLDRCYESWAETPGAIDLIRSLLNFPEK
ncbi:MAG: hypothetical protein Q9168_004337 [Polycauliona sp. 1 TL-2023]